MQYIKKGIIMGYMKTNYISFNILDFLEIKKVSPDHFRSLWQACDWENKIKVKKDKCTVDEYINLMKTKLKMTVIEELSINTSKFNTVCLYSRFVLGRDLLLNLSIEAIDDDVVGQVRLRSQNMGVVVLIGKHLRKLND